MPLYIQGTIKLIQVNNVKGKDATEDFTYYINFIQYEDKNGLEKVLEINSKADYRDRKDQMGAATLTAYKTKATVNGTALQGSKETTLYKLSLTDFTPDK